MFNRDALFGKRQDAPPPPGQRLPPRQQAPSSSYEKGYPAQTRVPPPQQQPKMRLQPAQSPDKVLTYSNICAVSDQDLRPRPDGQDYHLLLNGQYVLSARPMPGFPRGQVGLNEFQRGWLRIALTDVVEAEVFDLRAQGPKSYLGNMDVEIGFAGSKAPAVPPLDQDELADAVTRTFRDQVFAPGQTFLLDFRGPKLKITVRTVELVDLANLGASSTQETSASARGLLMAETNINFFKDAKSPIQLKQSTKRPAAMPVIRPDFKFADLGIGGLDAEFSDIFRRAFASRINPALAEKLGIQHVRGLLLHGPPGTGKTLIARQLGKMLNSREPKVINGPEVLNKYVGQSEENIRKLFADAEKEQAEKGDESQLHIIIFDELDAVCKQRGSGAGGGTGVGDSVVNQLLSKLDGVNQLNNILLIGMTNRKDMIDEALLRAGRLEVHMEISLPDEHGRNQILKIQTAKMRENDKLGSDVDFSQLAKQTRNFSGAEISGLVKAASSFALQRHIKGGTVAAVSDDIDSIKIRMADFESALKEVKPLFGVSEDVLEDCIEGGIIPYGPRVNKILKDGGDYVWQVSHVTSLMTVLLHGPEGSGKTALAAKIALESQFPFVKMVKAVDMGGMNELQKVQHLMKVFADAHKSPLNLVVLDDIESMIEWNPVGPRFSNSILSVLKGLMRQNPPKGRPLLILATTSSRTVLQTLELRFSAEIAVPALQSQEELAHVMRESGEFEDGGIRRAIENIEANTGGQSIGVGILHIIEGIQTSMRYQGEERVDRFVEWMSEAIGRAKY